MAASFVSRFGCRGLAFKLIKNNPESLAKRCISTSNKNKDTSTIAEPLIDKTKVTEAGEKPKTTNWISYGYSTEDEVTDRFQMHVVVFMGLSVCIIGGSFILAYMPDLRGTDWAHREAYLELHRRAAAGLPLVDRNLVDPSKLELPSDEELDDTEIII